ncbi:MAG: hypothetical protein MUC51_13870, partial [Anaerolineae bacterium]|nr:hypothetical protein [Anaerolineae bacterium]
RSSEAANERIGESAKQRMNESANRRSSESVVRRLSSVVNRLAPWAVFAALLVWGWRGQNLFHDIPTYGDVLELMWGISWYGDALRAGVDPAVYPLAFYPGGWQLATFGQSVGPALFLAMLPLHWIAGAAFAYQVAVLLTFVLAFGGTLALAGRFMGRLGATVVALLYTFWGFRWFQTLGHLNFLLGSACLPWMVWALERFLQKSSASIRAHTCTGAEAQHGRKWSRPILWLFLVGVAWAAAIAGSMYFIWIGGILLAGWLLGRRLGKQINWRTALIGFAIPAAVALLLSLPALLAYWRASSAIGAGSHDLTEVNFWGASLNSLPLPYIFSSLLGSFATSIYRGITYEQATTNLGLVAAVTAIGGMLVASAAANRRRWLPVLILTPVALILSLGLTLKWDNQALQWEALRPLNTVLWQLGHLLKPDVFAEAQPPAPFDAAIPLPGMLLAAVVPLFERARVFARYILIAALGVFLLSGLAVTRVRWGWARWLLAAVLIFEVIPPSLGRAPFPPPPHPAFEWLKSQPDGAVADVLAAHPGTLVLINRGETVWATRVHGKPAIAGASSVWPATTTFMNEWLATHPHAFTGPTAVPLLRSFGTRYLLLHMTSDWEKEILEEARQNPELKFIRCFEPPAGPGAWYYPICAFELQPPVNANVNLAPVEGWSGQEDWGVWAVGPESRASFVAMTQRPHRLVLEAFPNCIPGRTQALTVEVNGTRLAEHTWANCDPWAAAFTIPASLVRLGGNDVVIRPAYAVAPPDGDTRPLSVGFSKLRVDAEP